MEEQAKEVGKHWWLDFLAGEKANAERLCAELGGDTNAGSEWPREESALRALILEGLPGHEGGHGGGINELAHGLALRLGLLSMSGDEALLPPRRIAQRPAQCSYCQ